jgi:tetratricopeptide (TPR) repeat protein
MTARLLAFAVAALTPAAAVAQHFHHHLEAAPEDELRVSVCDDNRYTRPALDASRQGVDWEVTSKSTEAKLHFKQGLTLYYGFNYEDALRNFRRATELDKEFVMGWWGMALAAGPNINLGIDNTCLKMARAWSKRARDLALFKETTITPVELDLAKALTARYTTTGLQPKGYARAMEGVWGNRKPHADVGALYGESLMDLHPWALWDDKHKPTSDDTGKVLGVLTDVLGRYPNALGANHYWIHAVEAGPDPGSATDSAARLDTAVKGSGHLLHMPSHTYFLTGRYSDAVDANTRAIPVDFRQFDDECRGEYATYIANPRCLALYYGHYYSHNLFFRAVAEAFSGRYREAIADALATRKHAARFLPNEPGLQRYMTAPYLLYAAIGDWSRILDPEEKEPSCTPPPPFRYDSGCHIARAAYHWARGMAFTTQPRDPVSAKVELIDFLDQRKDIPPGPNSWGNNTAAAVLAVAEEVLRARIAWTEGQRDAAIVHLERAVANEDALKYDEPPQWFHPARQALGGAYLTLKQWAKARDVFVADLGRHADTGRSLYGLAYAYAELEDSRWHDCWARYEAAWGKADAQYRPMTIDRLWLLGMPAGPTSATSPASSADGAVPKWSEPASAERARGVPGSGQPGSNPLCYDPVRPDA